MTQAARCLVVLALALLSLLAQAAQAQAPTAQNKTCREVQFQNPCLKRVPICRWLPQKQKCVEGLPTNSPTTPRPTKPLKPCDEYYQKWACRARREDGFCFWKGNKETGYCVQRTRAPTFEGQTTKVPTPKPTAAPTLFPTKKPTTPPPNASKAPTRSPETSAPSPSPTKKHPPCSNFKTLLRCCGNKFSKTGKCVNAKVPNPGCVWRAKLKICAPVNTQSPTGTTKSPTTSAPTTGRPTTKRPTTPTKRPTRAPTPLEY